MTTWRGFCPGLRDGRARAEDASMPGASAEELISVPQNLRGTYPRGVCLGSLPPRFEGDYRCPMAPCRCVSLQWVATLAKDGQVCLVQIYAIALLASISSLQNVKSLEVMYKPSYSGS